MCGIWAYLHSTLPSSSTAPPRPLSDLFSDALQLAHRGPDHFHFEHLPTTGLTLAFHRLAIVNPTLKGNQPFKWEDPHTGKTLLLMCNGEIYNYKEFLAPLFYLMPVGQTLGSDCEVLLHLYRIKGFHGFLHTLQHNVRGEFAFVLFELDAAKRVTQVVAGRDAVGVRPLYVSSPGDDVGQTPLLFTSELKGALHYKGEMAEFPPGSVWRYTVDALGQIQEPERYTWTDALYETAPLSDASEAEQLPSATASATASLSTADSVRLATASLSTADSVRLATASLSTADSVRLATASLLANLRQAILASVQRRLEADRPLAFLLSGGIDSSLVAGLSARLLNKPIRTFCCSLSDKDESGKAVAVGRDVEYAREVAKHLGSEHTEVLFTKEEALQVIPDVVRTIESWDTTTVRASVGQYLVSRWIGQNTDCNVVLVGEGPDEVCSSYLFNWYAPSKEALDQSARDYVKKIHLYDGRRADRCIARWGLEARIPFLDPEFIQAYWQIPASLRMPTAKGIEKWWLREAFKDDNVVPERVRMRMKDAFSDSISGQVSWTQIIQEWVETQVTDEELQEAPARFPYQTPQTKEAYYYRNIFCREFGEHRQEILPGYWQPRWNKEGQEVKEYVDPSARTLSVYSTLTASSDP
jgi:asparagine synthase (glutamine-hydrolysing)